MNRNKLSLSAFFFLCGLCVYAQNVGRLEIPNSPPALKGQLIEHIGYTTSYNADLLIPNWVAYELTLDEASGDYPRKGSFCPDPDVLGRSATTYDYSNSGWDRGHMAPAADMKWSETSMKESFYLSNICPQDRSLNSGQWNTIEEAVRRWARQSGSVYVVCGPIIQEGYSTIGSNQVAVPASFFKVVLRKDDGEWSAIGFVFPNQQCSGSPYEYACTVDQVEEITGLDFFYQLPDEIENRIESVCNVKVWNR